MPLAKWLYVLVSTPNTLLNVTACTPGSRLEKSARLKLLIRKVCLSSRKLYVFSVGLSLLLGLNAPALAAPGQAGPVRVLALKSSARPTSGHFDFTYTAWGKELAKYVENGNVHYKRWKEDQGGLDHFLDQVAHLSPAEFSRLSPDDRKAFWLNVYNALTIKVVLEHYPISGNDKQYPPNSFRQIRSCWESKKFNVMGLPTTLYDIEHERLRHDFRDPRIHFAVVCASRSCAKLSPEPFVGKILDERLDQCTRDFFADPHNLAVDPVSGMVGVNKIFSWFTLDFAAKAGFTHKQFPPPLDEEIIASYVSFYVPIEERNVIAGYLKNDQLKLDYLPYDWALNDAP